MDYNTEEDVEAENGTTEEELFQQAEWRSLFNFTTNAHVPTLIIGLLLAVASGIVIPALAFFLGKIFDTFTNYGAGTISGSDLTKQVSLRGLELLGLGLASWLLNGGFFISWLSFGELQAKNVRNKLFEGMLQKEMEWYDMRKSGMNAMIPRLQTQIRELQIATSQPLGFAMQYTVTLFAALGLALYTAWNLTLVTIAAIPIAAVLLAWISAQMQPAIECQAEQLTQASKLANNAINAIDTVKYFNGQDYELWQYIEAIKGAALCYLTQARANALQIALVRITLLGMFVQGFYYGSHLVAIGDRTSGQIVTAFWACLTATQTMEQLIPQMIVLEKGRVAGATLLAVLNKVEKGLKVTRMIGKKAPRYCDGDIQIRCVSFAYPSRPERLALENASFFFPAGETTFVIGRSGCGKSTLGNLLLQFYSPASGDITFDGESIQVLDTNWLRNNITLVQQQSVLFNETIFRNIAFGCQDHEKVRREEVKRCLDTAALKNTISDLPNGLDTLVGAGGSALSGGQKQRVAIARARLRDTPILILDEATSALDHISRTLVIEAIRRWRQDKTTIMITHDITQIQDTEYVYVLDKGRIVQEGYRNALEEKADGAFAGFLHPGVEFPNRSTAATSKAQKRRPSLISMIEESPRASVDSNDSMDIRLPPKAAILPKAYYASPESVRSRRQSQSFIGSLPPVAMHWNRMSNAHMSMLPLRNFNLAAEQPSPMSGSSPIELEDFAPPWYELISEKTTQRMSIRRSSHHSALSLVAVSKPHRLKRFLRNKKGHTQILEDARDIASLKSILSTVWPQIRWKERIILICGFIAAFIHASATPVFSWVFSKLLGTFLLPSGAAHQALIWSMSVLGVAVIDATASYLMHYLLEMTGQAWVNSLRIQAMKRILNQPRSWFDKDKNNISGILECLDRNAEEMRNLVGRFAGTFFVAATMMTISCVWSMLVCWKLTLVGLATAPAVYGVTRGFEAISGKWESKSNQASEAAGAIFHETFVNIRTVRALTLEGYFHQKYMSATANAMRVGVQRAAYSGLFYGLSDASIIFITALIFYYGSVLAASNEFSAQSILTVFSMLLFSIANVNAIVAYIPQINSSRDTATRLLKLTLLPTQSHESIGHIRLTTIPGSIHFSALNFNYPLRPTFPVLSALTLSLAPHTSTALVGPSGSGKSTIASLLLRLYPADTPSSLSIGPIPLASLHLPSWRALIGYVPQQPTLFPTTIANNIAYGLPANSPHATPAAIAAAATQAGIHAFIASLPLGYATPVGDGGIGLSGGQVQRIGIARALVRKPKLLVMDEPTSGLDAEAAEGIRRLVGRQVQEGVTVLVVTHSWEMMRACGTVVVLGEGRVVESGEWDDLFAREGGALRMLLGKKDGGGEGVGEGD